MLIKTKITNGWKLIKEHNDIEMIHKQSNISRTTISSALRTGRMNEGTFEAINKFYNEKKAKQDALQKTSKTVVAVEDDGN